MLTSRWQMMRIYVVQRGDTLSRISHKFGTTNQQIVAANGLEDPNRLVVGEALVIPGPYQQYVVQAGDTLWAIAHRFGVAIQEIVKANQLTDPSRLFVGQVLTIPVIYHSVQPGETLWLIANRYGVSVSAIVQANHIQNPEMLYIGQRLRIPEAPKRAMEVNAYITRMGQNGANLVSLYAPYLTYISPFSHSVTETGSIPPLDVDPILTVSRNRNVSPLLVITNPEFNPDKAAIILRNEGLQNTLITNILNELKQKGYSGVNIDFEYVYPEDKENFNNFLRRVVKRLKPEGYSVSTALAPKYSSEQKGLQYAAHDYRAHGEIVDFVVIMTYEWGWIGGPPKAVAPINEVRKVLDYAVSVIPRHKIVMGIPLYGYDWKIPWKYGTWADTITPREAVNIAAKNGVAINYDKTSESPFFHYTDQSGGQHEVWFEDARSFQAKYDTAKEYNLRGVSYWVLGAESPQNWPVLDANFNIIKK